MIKQITMYSPFKRPRKLGRNNDKGMAEEKHFANKISNKKGNYSILNSGNTQHRFHT